jgi:hypothetical protein
MWWSGVGPGRRRSGRTLSVEGPFEPAEEFGRVDGSRVGGTSAAAASVTAPEIVMLEWLTGYGEAAIAVGSEAWMAHTRCHLSCGPEVVCSFSSALRSNVRYAHICA